MKTLNVIRAEENMDGFSALTFNGNKIVSPIRDAKPCSYIELKDRIIVQFWKNEDIDEQNVFAFGRDGRIIWRVEKYNQSEHSGPFTRNPYMSMRLNSENRIKMRTSLEMPVYLDPETGAIERLPGRFEEGGEY